MAGLNPFKKITDAMGAQKPIPTKKNPDVIDEQQLENIRKQDRDREMKKKGKKIMSHEEMMAEEDLRALHKARQIKGDSNRFDKVRGLAKEKLKEKKYPQENVD